MSGQATIAGVSPDLPSRICGEYLEMPGLRLTVEQAARLWNMDPATTRLMLNALVDVAFLRRSGDFYIRDSGKPVIRGAA